MEEKPKMLVLLVKPEDCLRCRFASTAIVDLENGSSKRMIFCQRLDCDNWNYSSVETPIRVRPIQD